MTGGTAGLSSPYQVTEYAAATELGYNLIDTGGTLATPILEIIDEKRLAALFETEVILIRIPLDYEDMALYLLSKVSQFQSLPDHVYALKRADLRFLEEAGIPYEQIL